MAITAPRQYTDFDTAWRSYLGDSLPPGVDPGSAERMRPLADLRALIGEVDALLLDGFGVLNVGPEPVPGMIAQLEALRAAGVLLLVLSNGSTQPKAAMVAKYAALGHDFAAEELITSRDALLQALAAHAREHPDFVWGVSPTGDDAHPDLPGRWRVLQGFGDYMAVDGLLLLSTARWSARHDWWLGKALHYRPRPLWVANPDVCAPFPGRFSREPGQVARALALSAAIELRWFGKPHGNAFALALEAAARRLPTLRRERVAMVGDSPHTDIIGARAAGLRSVLVAEHGLLAGQPLGARLAEAGIWPDWVIRA